MSKEFIHFNSEPYVFAQDTFSAGQNLLKRKLLTTGNIMISSTIPNVTILNNLYTLSCERKIIPHTQREFRIQQSPHPQVFQRLRMPIFDHPSDEILIHFTPEWQTQDIPKKPHNPPLVFEDATGKLSRPIDEMVFQYFEYYNTFFVLVRSRENSGKNIIYTGIDLSTCSNTQHMKSLLERLTTIFRFSALQVETTETQLVGALP